MPGLVAAFVVSAFLPVAAAVAAGPSAAGDSGADGAWCRVGLLMKPIVQPIPAERRRLTAPDELKFIRDTVSADRAAAVPAASDREAAGETLDSLSGIRYLVLESGIRSVSAEAFATAADLETVEFRCDLRLIGRGAFAHSPKLSCVVFREPVSTDVAADAFAGCSPKLTLFYPFWPTVTAQDGSGVMTTSLFNRIAFAGGECGSSSVYVSGDWLWTEQGVDGAKLLKYLGTGTKPAEPAWIRDRRVVSRGGEL